ncbi:hypothetical protein ACHAWC_004483 [Mediolabrus comicus]
MSKLSDYSKFDHIDDVSSSDDDETDKVFPVAAATSSAQPSPINNSNNNNGRTKKHPTEPNRYIFEYSGQKVYEWEQSLEEVTIYIDAPPNLPKDNAGQYVVVNILPAGLQVGLRGSDRYFIDERTFDKVKVKESSWYIDDGVIIIVLAKVFRGQTWEGVLRGHESIDPLTKQEMQRTMMLERFQEENPGFDFRDAKFNGEVPDPRTFMGGVGYNN